eukprot:6916635-Pyramimonas_sp.AAC.1
MVVDGGTSECSARPGNLAISGSSRGVVEINEVLMVSVIEFPGVTEIGLGGAASNVLEASVPDIPRVAV